MILIVFLCNAVSFSQRKNRLDEKSDLRLAYFSTFGSKLNVLYRLLQRFMKTSCREKNFFFPIHYFFIRE